MATIREYQRQFGTPTGETGPRASADAFGGNVFQELGRAGDVMQTSAAMIDRLAQDREIADAQVKMAEAEVAFGERVTELRKTAQPGVSTAEQIRTEMGDYFSQMSGNYKHRGAQKYVQVSGMGLTQKYFRNSLEFDVDLNVKDRTAKIGKIDELDKNRVLQDPASYSEIKARRQMEIEAGIGVWSSPTDDARTKLAITSLNDKAMQDMAYLAGVSSIAIPAVRNNLVGQSSAALNPTRNSIIDGVIKREGGETIVENDAGRGVTKFGINGVANGLTPEQTRALTREQATQLYTDRWNKYGVGDLPTSVQNIVFDGVVNHGSAFAQQLTNAAKQGATVEQLAQMRLTEYQRLAATNPEQYGKYLQGWTNRVAEVSAQPGDNSLMGYTRRTNLFPGEDKFFKENPNVAGMAAEDGTVILNPYSKLSDVEKQAVAKNEAYRLFMRDKKIVPDFTITDEQRKQFEGSAYAKDDVALKQTIVARILTGDPSAKATDEQRKVAAQIASKAGGAAANQEPILPEIKNAPEWYNDLTAENKLKILKMADQQAQRERSIADAALKKTVADHEAYVTRFGQMPPDVLPDSAFTDPAERQSYRAVMAAGGKVAEIAAAPFARQEEMLNELRPVPGTDAPGVFAFKEKVYANAQRMVFEQNKMRMADPVAFAYSHKYSVDNPIQPITDFSAENFAESIKVRIPQMVGVSTQLGQPPVYLMKNEAAQLAANVANLPPTQKQEYMRKLGDSMNRDEYNTLVNQVWKDDAAMRLAGKLTKHGQGLTQNGQTADKIVSVMMVGNDILNQKLKGGGTEAEKGFKGILPNFSDVRQLTGEYLKGVQLPETAVQAVSEAVMAHYVGTLASAGVPKSYELSQKESANRAAFRKSLETVVGTLSDVGGSRVMRPFGMTDTEFQTKIKAQVGALDPSLRGYTLSVADGEGEQYWVTVGNVPKYRIGINDPIMPRQVAAPAQEAVEAPVQTQQQPARPGPLTNFTPFRLGGN